MAPRNPLIRHAITPPAFNPRTAIHRERLVDAIHAEIESKLIAIGAPAGSGKTTLLADFADNTDLTICWMRLSEGDWDVMRFAELLAASLHARFRRLKGQPDLQKLAGSSPEALAVAFATTIDEQISEAFIIAIDDVHLINQSKPVLALLDRLLLDLPQHVTVIAAGREILESSVLAQLMAEQELAGFGPHHLALTREELSSLTELMQGEVPPDAELDRLLEESRGWVTAVVLSQRIADIGAGALIGGGRQMVYEYLASVVLNRQPDKLRRFALDAAVLPIMVADTCDRVLGRDDSRKYLARLESKGLFVTASQSSPKTYEFHPLFRQFLLESMENADPGRLASLRRRAAEHYLERDAQELAVDLLIDAGSISRAAKLAESCSKAMHDLGRNQTLAAWADRLRTHEASMPKLLLELALSALDRGDLETAEKLLAEGSEQLGKNVSNELRAHYEIIRGFVRFQQANYQAALRAVRTVDKIFSKRGNRRLQGFALRLHALVLIAKREDLAKAEELLQEAADKLVAEEDRYNRLLALLDLGVAQYWLGKAPEQRSTRRKTLQLARQIGAPLPLAAALGNETLGAYEEGEYERAMRLSHEALKAAKLAASPLREGIILHRQADIYADIGLVGQAANLYDRALAIFMDLEARTWIRDSCVQSSILHRRIGGNARAKEWLKRALVWQEDEDPPAVIRVQMAAVEIAAAPDRTLSMLGAVSNEDVRPDPRELVLLEYFRGRALMEKADQEAAAQSFADALAVAGTHHTEQYLAAELRFDTQTRAVIRELAPDPTLALVMGRVERMVALARRYEAPTVESDSETSIRAEAMGASRVLIDGSESTDLKPQAKEVLFYLLDRGEVRRDRLMEAFWATHPPGKQTSNLHTAISSVRGELGKSTIVLEGAVYSVAKEASIDYDVRRFEQAVAAARGLPPADARLLFALNEARHSYGGPFLPEYDSDWVIERRQELELEYLDMLASYGYEAIVHDQPGEALGALREALRIDPYRDDTNMRYMEALGRLDRRAEIVAHYQEYIRLLADDLGLDPPDKVRELYAQLIS